MDLPVTQSGFCRTETHLAWMKEQQWIERQANSENNITNVWSIPTNGKVATKGSDNMELDSSVGSNEESRRIADDSVTNRQEVEICGNVRQSPFRAASTVSTSRSSSSSLSSTPSPGADATAIPLPGNLPCVVPAGPEENNSSINVGNTPSVSPPTTSNSIEEPTASDILLGRGRVIDTRPGNMKFRQFLAQQLEHYEQAPKFQKTEIAESLLRHLKDSCHVRFLKELPDGKGFMEVDDKTAREKISRTFRRIRETKRGIAAT